MADKKRSIDFEHEYIKDLGADLPVKEVGFDNGFGNPLYFSTAFKKHFGVSPSEFRRLAREGKIKPTEIDMNL